MKKVTISNQYESFRLFINNIEKHFLTEGEWMRDDRNQLKRIQVEGYDLCVKSFGRATVFNRLMYSYFRKSKARRSYEYAQRLVQLGIGTPAPVAYVEVYNRLHFMTRSYYVSLYADNVISLTDVLSDEVPGKHVILRDFVRFVTDKVHRNGVCHRDFNGTNVLVEKNGVNKYHFMLVDLNRVKFGKPLNYHNGLRNLQQVHFNPVYLAELARYYARVKKADENDTIYELLFMKYLRKIKRHYTKQFLHALKTMF